jgi:hypothetical protein
LESQITTNTTALNTCKFWKGTQAEYDALGSYDNNTIYFIQD